jgi:uncharacterized coiled-coil protein SlyX
MTYTEFKDKWLGKGIDFDGKYGFQCVDVYRMYVKEVLGVPQSPPVVGAKDIWDNYLKEYFTRIENTVEAVPKQGDVIIWSVGTYGHIAICDSANKDSFISFEQNWTHLDGTGVTELRTHQYKNVLGWLRPIINSNIDITDEQKRILDFIGTRTEGDVREAFGALADKPNKDEQIRILNERISFYETKIKELEETIVTLQGRIEDNGKVIDGWQQDFRTANEQLTKTLEDLDKMTTEKADYRRRYEDALSKSVDKYSAIELITLGVKKLFVK